MEEIKDVVSVILPVIIVITLMCWLQLKFDTSLKEAESAGEYENEDDSCNLNR